jgi:hypothetical protein
MQRFLVLLCVFASILIPGEALAAGAMMRPAPVPLSRDGVPLLTPPYISANDMLDGCGRGRFRGAATSISRGPSDLAR